MLRAWTQTNAVAIARSYPSARNYDAVSLSGALPSTCRTIAAAAAAAAAAVYIENCVYRHRGLLRVAVVTTQTLPQLQSTCIFTGDVFALEVELFPVLSNDETAAVDWAGEHSALLHVIAVICNASQWLQRTRIDTWVHSIIVNHVYVAIQLPDSRICTIGSSEWFRASRNITADDNEVSCLLTCIYVPCSPATTMTSSLWEISNYYNKLITKVVRRSTCMWRHLMTHW